MWAFGAGFVVSSLEVSWVLESVRGLNLLLRDLGLVGGWVMDCGLPFWFFAGIE